MRMRVSRVVAVTGSLCCLVTWSDVASAGAPSLAPIIPNPAAMMFALPGITAEANVTTVIGRTVVQPTAVSNPVVPNLIGYGDSGNMNKPRGQFAAGVVFRAEQWAVGFTTNPPYTQETLPNPMWAGMFYARDTRAYSQNYKPQVAVQVTPWLNVGAGLQIQQMSVELAQAIQLAPGFASLNFKGSSVDYGYAVGATVSLSPATVLGIGYRSKVDQRLNGTITRPAVPSLLLPAVTLPAVWPLPMPETVNLSLFQRISPAWSILAEADWAHWSRFSRLPISVDPAGVPGVPSSLNFQWRDTWRFSAVVHYQWSPVLSMRAGARYEQASVTDRTRTVSAQGADHIRLSAGINYDLTERLTLDLSYAHNFARHVPVIVVPGHPNYSPTLGTFFGQAEIAADYIGVGLRYYWGCEWAWCRPAVARQAAR